MGYIEVLIIVVVGILLLIIFYLLGIYNKLLFLKNKIEEKYQTLNEEIKNIIGITDKVIDIVKGNYGEDSVQDVKIVKRNLEGEENTNDRMHKVVGLIKFLNFVKEKMNDNNKLKEYTEEVNDSLNRIEYASKFYNECVMEYNKYKETKLASIISKIFKFKDYNECNIVENANRI